MHRGKLGGRSGPPVDRSVGYVDIVLHTGRRTSSLHSVQAGRPSHFAARIYSISEHGEREKRGPDRPYMSAGPSSESDSITPLAALINQLSRVGHRMSCDNPFSVLKIAYPCS